jgi:3-hydroxyisobutyrate dehydrogenase-like beta-hydroxyacid dehydrogenase
MQRLALYDVINYHVDHVNPVLIISKRRYQSLSAEKLRIGFAGAGILGSAIMRRLLDCGFGLNVWNRNPEKLRPLIEAGAGGVGRPIELAQTSDVVMTCVTDGAAVEAILFGDDGLAAAGSAEKMYIDMSTTDAEHTRMMAARLREQCNMAWLDAPISGGAPAALTGSMAIMVGGSEEDFKRAQPIWDALAGRCTLMGGIGAGQTTKMINQLLVACGFVIVAEACNLAERAGVDAGGISQALEGGRADSRLLQEYMPKMATSDFSLTGPIGNMLKDLEMIHDLARATNAALPITSIVTELFRKLVADGLSRQDNSEVIRLYRTEK